MINRAANDTISRSSGKAAVETKMDAQRRRSEEFERPIPPVLGIVTLADHNGLDATTPQSGLAERQ